MMNVLYVDSREPDQMKTLVEETVQKRDMPVAVQEEELDTGDFVFGDIVFERKDASDFVSSITEGRLSEQSSKMCMDFGDKKFVIVEGDVYNVEHSNLSKKSIIGMFCSLGYKKDVKVVPVQGPFDTAFAVARIIEYSLDGDEFDPAEFALSRTEADKEDVVVSMLACVEGVSVDKSRSIIEQVGADTVSDLKSADLQVVDGVGDVLESRIKEAL